MNMLNKIFGQQKDDLEVAASQADNGDTPNDIALRKKTMLEYDKLKSLNEISVFEKEIKSLVQIHLSQTEYKEHKVLLREIESLVHYTIEVLKDDYVVGNRFFTKNDRLTKLDDYVFSQFGKEDKLAENIQKMKIIAQSNRFDENPRQNLLSYFVFLEETGLEIITMLGDFYSMLDKSQNKSRWSFNYKSIFKFKPELYMKKPNESSEGLMDETGSATQMLKTMMTKELEMSPRTVQKALLQDRIKREGEQNK